MIARELKDLLKVQTVNVLLGVRRQYLAAGASPLKHWEQLQTRARRAARTAATVDEWFSTVCRGLNLGPPDSVLSAELALLRGTAAAVEPAWVQMVEDENPALMARCRVLAEARAEARRTQDSLRENTEAQAAERPGRKKKGAP